MIDFEKILPDLTELETERITDDIVSFKETIANRNHLADENLWKGIAAIGWKDALVHKVDTRGQKFVIALIAKWSRIDLRFLNLLRDACETYPLNVYIIDIDKASKVDIEVIGGVTLRL